MPTILNQNTSPLNNRRELQRRVPFQPVTFNMISRGNLCYFQYLYWHVDRSPLVLITDIFLDRMRGVNLNYLSLNYFKNLTQKHLNNRNFSYDLFKGDKTIVSAFRTYKKTGIINIKRLDEVAINEPLKELRTVHKYNPQEIKAIREHLQSQLRNISQVNVEELAGNVETNRSATIPGIPTQSAIQSPQI